MSSACPGPRFVRCRVRDLASCFYACRLPLEEEKSEIACRKPPETSSGSIVYDFEGGGRGRKTSKAKKLGGESSVQSSSSSNINRSNGRVEAEPHFAEEDYIVFCFREDGAIDMVNTDGKSLEENGGHNNMMTTAVTVLKGEEKQSTETNTEPNRPDDEMKEMMKPVCVEKPSPSKVESCESSDSNLSDTTSTSSFAFPVMGIEWIGSPVHMPRSGSGNQNARLHCCRF